MPNKEKHLFYIDESGNAGANLLDAQPFFIIIGIGIRESHLDELESKFNALKIKYGFRSDEEIKGSELIKSESNSLMREASGLILSEGLPITGVIIERKFMTCGLIVETFFDPEYNDLLDNKWTYPLPIKVDIANHFYNYLSTNTVRFAAQTVVIADIADLHQLLNLVQAEIAEKPIIDGINLVATMEGARKYIEDLSSVIKRVHNIKESNMHMSKGTLKAPNVTSFFDMLHRIEHIYDNHPEADVGLVFDSSSQFDRPFREIYELLKRAGPAKMEFPDRMPLTFGFTRINSFEVKDSAATPLLQSADFFATGLRYIHELSLAGAPLERKNDAVMFYIGFMLSAVEIGMINIVASNNIKSCFWNMAKKYLPQ